MVTPEAVLDFWFLPLGEPGHGAQRKAWFVADPAFDAEVRRRFAAAVDAAALGTLDHWQDEGSACLALVLLLDQFPRNIHRGTAGAYLGDDKARAAAAHALARGYDREVGRWHRVFFYLPFEHSEDLADQRLSMELLGSLGEDAEGQQLAEAATRHLRVIERFGRFPHRNEILGRPSTPEELAYLAGPGPHY